MKRIAPLTLALLLGKAVCSDDIFLGEDQKSGLIDLTDSDDMFYWLFKSRRGNENEPLVMWLTGGPGCASETALFNENGPFSI